MRNIRTVAPLCLLTMMTALPPSLSPLSMRAGESAAAAASAVLRPDGDVVRQWTGGTPGPAWSAIDDAVIQPTGVAATDYIWSGGANRVTEVNLSAAGLSGSASGSKAWFYANTGSSTRLRVDVVWGGSVHATTTVIAAAPFAWRSVTATPPNQASVNDVRLRFTTLESEGSDGRDSNVRATYFELVGGSSTRFSFDRLSDPNRTVVKDADGRWVATFTDGAYTVQLLGPARTFTEPTTTSSVTTTTWVRALPAPFSGTVDQAWLENSLADTTPDVLARAMQYVEGAAAGFNGSGLQITGDANYGPLKSDGTRQEGSDFNDYLGVAWAYGAHVDQPESAQFHSLDCSGYMRMVWGYRSGLPLTLTPNGTGIPRRAFEMLDTAPGLVTIPNRGIQATAYGRLLPGDLVFFDAATDDGAQIDHVGMHLGVDSGGRHRFISSRKTTNGPTLGDTGGRSLLDGTGFYATSFRASRRL